VGRDANVTSAGIHADGLLKNEEIYNPFDTARLLKRPVRVALNDKSGAAGVAHWVRERYDLAEDLSKDDPRVRRVAAWVEEQYDQGRIAAMSDEEMDAKVHEVFGDAATRKPETK
jgi:isopropylmalate/homocitrate/citramalate synthase